jgi:hypothetical protein
MRGTLLSGVVEMVGGLAVGGLAGVRSWSFSLKRKKVFGDANLFAQTFIMAMQTANLHVGRT